MNLLLNQKDVACHTYELLKNILISILLLKNKVKCKIYKKIDGTEIFNLFKKKNFSISKI